jgi:hypothetical protein
MHRSLTYLVIVGLGCLWCATPARADDPLRLVPDVADVVVKIEQPRQLVQMLLDQVPAKELQGIRGYREFYESTNYRRFLQLLSHFERELKQSWPDLLDQLAGNGIVLATKIEKQGAAPALLIIDGKNADTTKLFWKVATEIVEQELARQDAKQVLERKSRGEVQTLKVGDDFHAARIGATLLISNKAKGLEAAHALLEGKEKKSIIAKPSLVEGRKLAGDGALAWAWLSLEQVRKDDQFKNLYELPNQFFPFPVALGGLTDAIRRSDFVVAALRKEGNSPVLSIRLPAGKEGLHEALIGHAPPDNAPPLRPLLEPKGVLFSMTYFHDLAKFWEKREQILPKDQLEQINKAEQASAPFLLGTRFGEIMGGFGARHRLVAVRQEQSGYSVKPENAIPAFAWVVEARDAEKFAKSIEPPIRSINLLTGAFVRMDPIEEMHGAHKIVGYRFAEQQKAGKLDRAFNGTLANFSPCFVRVGDQIIFSSTIELAHTLVNELEREVKNDSSAPKTATVRSQFYWEGLSSFLAGQKDTLTTQSILAEGSSPEEARQQVALLLDLLQKLGKIELDVDMEAKVWKLDLRARVGTGK